MASSLAKGLLQHGFGIQAGGGVGDGRLGLGFDLRGRVEGDASHHADALGQFVHGIGGGGVEILEAQVVVAEVRAGDDPVAALGIEGQREGGR